MTTRQQLEKERDELRNLYAEAKKHHEIEELEQIEKRGKEITTLLNNLCLVCNNEFRAYNEYYCSKECNDKLYPKQVTKTAEQIQDRIKVIIQEIHEGKRKRFI